MRVRAFAQDQGIAARLSHPVFMRMHTRLGYGMVIVPLCCAALFAGAQAQPAKTEEPLKFALPAPHPAYPMNYADEAAQTLGVHDGRLDAFSLAPKEDVGVPAVRGGLSKKGPSVEIIIKTN